jgi:uncharacterized protein YndB with AHSA1/START domain
VRRLEVSRTVAASPAVVWDLLVTVAQWPRWGPSVRAVELDREPDTGPGTGRIGPGSRGRVQTAVGVRLPFEITGFEPGRAWSWAVCGIEATDHTVEATDTGTRVSFGVPWLAAPYLAVCAAALRRLEQLAVQEVRR